LTQKSVNGLHLRGSDGHQHVVVSQSNTVERRSRNRTGWGLLNASNLSGAHVPRQLIDDVPVTVPSFVELDQSAPNGLALVEASVEFCHGSAHF
jgi:hypothetical protein